MSSGTIQRPTAGSKVSVNDVLKNLVILTAKSRKNLVQNETMVQRKSGRINMYESINATSDAGSKNEATTSFNSLSGTIPVTKPANTTSTASLEVIVVTEPTISFPTTTIVPVTTTSEFLNETISNTTTNTTTTPVLVPNQIQANNTKIELLNVQITSLPNGNIEKVKIGVPGGGAVDLNLNDATTTILAPEISTQPNLNETIDVTQQPKSTEPLTLNTTSSLDSARYKKLRFCSLFYGGIICKDSYVLQTDNNDDNDVDDDDSSKTNKVIDDNIEDDTPNTQDQQQQSNQIPFEFMNNYNLNYDPYEYSTFFKNFLQDFRVGYPQYWRRSVKNSKNDENFDDE